MPYRLYYWPSIQGRGEFVRLALEEAGVAYADVARGPEVDGEGVPALLRILEDASVARPPFAPPFLDTGERLVAQTAEILQLLGARHGLAPDEEGGRLWTHQLQLTIADWVAEVHDTHHPIGSGLYYEDQRPEARRRAADFVASRLPKYLGYFERVLERNPPGTHLVGTATTSADLSLFQIVEGLRYAFPRLMARLEPEHPRVVALRERVARRPRIAAYLVSPRRIAFNEEGIFRHYPELDAA